ncbi:MAG: hypothetical protein JO363_11935 [Solirubrobacterales bacterium]|nr:hypothetical protein [Solirubrobacterales bacterium]
MLVRRPSFGPLAAAFQEDAEVAPGGRMAPLVRAAIGSLSAVGGAGFFEQAATVERATRIATLIRARECRLGVGELGARFEHCAELARGTGVTSGVGASIGPLRASEIALLLQEQAEIVYGLPLVRLRHGCRRIPAGVRARPEANPVRSQPPYEPDNTRASVLSEADVASGEAMS